jgi:hypothetical protein
MASSAVDVRPCDLVLNHRAVERRRDRFHRHVVRRPSEPAGDDDRVEGVAVLAGGLRDDLPVVGDRQHPLDAQAPLGELP